MDRRKERTQVLETRERPVERQEKVKLISSGISLVHMTCVDMVKACFSEGTTATKRINFRYDHFGPM